MLFDDVYKPTSLTAKASSDVRRSASSRSRSVSREYYYNRAPPPLHTWCSGAADVHGRGRVTNAFTSEALSSGAAE